MKQATLLSFFTRSSVKSSTANKLKNNKPKSVENITPTSSSPIRGKSQSTAGGRKFNSDPIKKNTPNTPKSTKKQAKHEEKHNLVKDVPSSPLETLSSGRRVRKVNYSEFSDDEDEDDEVVGGRRKRRKVHQIVAAEDDSDSDEYHIEDEDADVVEDEDEDADELQNDKSYVEEKPDLGDDVVVDDDDDDDDDIVIDDEAPRKSRKKSIAHKQSKRSEEIHAARSSSTPEEDNDKMDLDEMESDKVAHPTSSVADKFSAGSTFVAKKEKAESSTLSILGKKRKHMTPQNRFSKENEERYQWLVNVKDAEGRPETDPEYDSRTLYIPNSAWSKFSAFEKQYWAIKCKMWDTVVFFKKGKFFELYENDADIAHQKFDLKLAGTGRANMRLAGIPEMSFDYWAKRFVDEGYKVAKVIQKETSLGKQMRERNSRGKSKASKVIKRELDCVLTCGTLTDQNMLTDDMSKYCLSIKERVNEDASKTFGVCFVDTSTGKLEVTQFDDDPECGRLETLLAQVQPMEVLVEKSKISPLAMKILRFNSHAGAFFNFLKPETEFLGFDSTFEQLCSGKYFSEENPDDLTQYPAILRTYYKSEKIEAFSAFGALLWYLKSLKLDKATISMGNITEYDPFKSTFANATMRLDGVTLQNLEIFSNSFDQSSKGTLFRLLNRGVTSFGKRAFRNWVMHPLTNKKLLDERLDSVELLMNDGELRSLIEHKLSSLPDLERLLARVHSGSLQVKDFSKVISGFETIMALIRTLSQTYGAEGAKVSGSLGRLIKSFPHELEACISKWSSAFDRRAALEDGVLIPAKGVEPEFDQSQETVKGFEQELEDTIRRYRKEYRCQEMCYKDYGKELYLIEVPRKAVSRIPEDWQQMSATSKSKRYWSPEVKELVQNLLEARETHRALCDTLEQKMYARFDSDCKTWTCAVQTIAQLDCLISLVRASESLGSPLCRPKFVDGDRAFLDFKELRHPCFIPGGSSGTRDFIPNDVSLGSHGKGQIALLTGANAAGKSTLLRMTGVAVIMAQIGCFIPAKEATLVPVDAIMTRLGANDNIMQGKSTFFVELSETKRMLDNATPKSLIILDELGRGGSSSDGFAIAEAVLHHIATHVQSIGFFATHYGTLGQSFLNHKRIQPLRMGILVDEESRNITFLYKLQPGKSNGSFGMHVASMCGVPREIVDNAEVAAKTHEHTSRLKKVHESQESIIPLGLESDFSWIDQKKPLERTCAVYNENVKKMALKTIFELIDGI